MKRQKTEPKPQVYPFFAFGLCALHLCALSPALVQVTRVMQSSDESTSANAPQGPSKDAHADMPAALNDMLFLQVYAYAARRQC